MNSQMTHKSTSGELYAVRLLAPKLSYYNHCGNIFPITYPLKCEVVVY